MKIRTECPKHNKYYIRLVTGGLNGAVAGSPTQPYANVLDNCVGYANGRFNECWNDPDLKGIVKSFHVQLVCNAENFIESAKRQGLKISKTPVVGGIMVWQRGATLSGGDGAGHVAVVERVYDDGTILTSESGWASWAFKTVRRDNSNGRWGQNSAYKFRGCIINPAVKTVITKAPKLEVDGVGGACTIRAMQRFFGTVQDGVLSGQSEAQSKFYPSIKAVEYGDGGSACVKKLQKWVGTSQDGVLGEKTVKAWQKKIGVASDGIFGANSMRAWQEYLNTHDKATYSTSKGKQIANQAIAYCGDKDKEKAAYKAAAKSVYGTGNDTYCHRFVGVVLAKCGYPKMDYSGKTAEAWKKIEKYLKENLEQVSGSPQEGDVHMTENEKGARHIFIELGGGKKAEANSKKKYYPHQAKTGKGAKNWLFRAK